MGPERIICLTEEPTEMLYLLGEEKRIVGISVYTERPPKAKEEKTKVSAFISGNLKKITALEPDLVIGFSDIQSQLAKDLIERGLNVLIFNQRSIREILSNMQILGNLVGQVEKTNSLIEEWKSQINLWKQVNTSKSYKPKVFFQEWDEPMITGIQWVSEAIELAGGIDCFSHLKEKKLAKDRIITAEDVATANPDVYVGSWCGKAMDWDWVRNKPEWQSTNFLKSNRIFELDPSIILQPGPALFLEGIPKLKEIFSSL
ncbi:cobalamin-binding protein [Leptospira sp. 2 VSF19]|uniref:Cobalamin-binding protein n=1 Tax=Leptospira soteropolitanensis TaxID=2950025 RepID=A0AAW5V8K0_9LEPT|nr:cobalamin-binding protein [Leptospira soteropolitanensis]MCW7491699.1 cobalamin-binding protein [Leptospira soteropolitanensis]MCW7499284.1 cobalamin-binding protein [Leptospira soteropolitanensis]MCW7521125.1 cobalamin-binding protein [Leptospira soteropolitanensis]MCW7525387.1 cobalamin-binding protein [Leptospira soteropolitanensis]MCW7529254.1 cobalamin-binding protein [Leptospira soteropolitanensis]